MRLILKLPAHVTLEEVVDGMAHAGWRVLTLPPELHHLYPGYWVAARAIIFEHLNRARSGEVVAADASREIELADERDVDAFVSALAGAIMHRLEGVHCGTCGVECAAPHLPEALHHALHVYAKESPSPGNHRVTGKAPAVGAAEPPGQAPG